MQSDHERFMRLALAEAARSKAEGNVAVGSVIVYGDSVVARGRNLVKSTHDVTAHAETVALREAGKALQRVELAEHVLYTTVEPCPMCCGAIMASGLRTLVMGARPTLAQRRWRDYSVETLLDLAGWRDNIEVVTGILVAECTSMWLE